MNTVVKEEKTMGEFTMSYLKIYEEFISGYKQYKMEKAELYNHQTEKAESDEK